VSDLTPASLPVVGSHVIVHPADRDADWAEGWPGVVVEINTSRFTVWHRRDCEVDLAGHGTVWFGLDEIEVVVDDA
jgi:hypothetical protein